MFKKIMLSLCCSISVLMASCSPKPEAENSATPAPVSLPDLSIEESTIHIQDGFIRPPLGGKTVTAGYFTMTLGRDDRLLSATSSIAETIELHTHEVVDGMMQMRKLDGLQILAGVPVVFEPKGHHLMLFGVNALPEGESADVVFTFESGRTAAAKFDFSVPDVSKGAGHEH